MRILLDTNVLFSAILFPNGQAAKSLLYCVAEHEIIIPSYVVDELKRVIKKKYPSKLTDVDLFFEKFSFDLAYTPENIPQELFHIRDPKDYPILYIAISENIDVVISGDEDFKDTDITYPEILTPSEFINKYC